MPRNISEYNPSIGYRYILKMKARIEHECGGFLLKTNNLGFRCNHEDTFRVLLLGDSFTAGFGVSNKYRFGDILESFFPKMQIHCY